MLKSLEHMLGEGVCAISIISNPFIDSSINYIYLNHLRDVSYVVSLVKNKPCRELAIVYSNIASDIRFAEYLVKRIKSMGIKKIITIIADVALSVSALLPLLSDSIYIVPWGVIGTLDPLISYIPTMPKESVILKDLVEQLMISVPKEGTGAKAQVMHALAVSGLYYEYEIALKSISYIEKILLERLEGEMSDDKISELMDRLLNKIEIHDQPMSAEEFVSLVPYANILKGTMLTNVSRYYDRVLTYLRESNAAIVIEDSIQTYEVPLTQQGLSIRI